MLGGGQTRQFVSDLHHYFIYAYYMRKKVRFVKTFLGGARAHTHTHTSGTNDCRQAVTRQRNETQKQTQ